MRVITKVLKELKLEFISRNPFLFKQISKHRAYCLREHISSGLTSDMKILANLIRMEFSYSKNTGDYDLVNSWINTYEDSIFYKISITKKNTMSKELPDHKTLVSRIRDVLQNEGHKDHHEMLIELFPEIYASIENETWHKIHKIGHVYARLVNNDKYISSLLMPIVIPGHLTITDSYQHTVAILNLIAGNFWKNTINVSHYVNDIPDHDWKHLFEGMDSNKLIHLGSFEHGNDDIYMLGNHKGKYKLYQINDFNE